MKRVAVTSDKKFHSAKKIRHRKACYKRTRKHLQANGSKSAKRALQRVSGREKRFVSDTNHCTSKQIVARAKAANQRIVLEELTGIRASGKAKVVHDWSFAELQAMISEGEHEFWDLVQRGEPPKPDYDRPDPIGRPPEVHREVADIADACTRGIAAALTS